jgi:glucosamine-6-phosphate deaminase
MSNIIDECATRRRRVESLDVAVFDTPVDLAVCAAETAAEYLRGLIARQGAASVIFATGNSQLRFLEALRGEGGIDWSRVTVFHMDEYLGLSAGHAASFRRFIQEKIADPLKPGQVHFLNGDADEPVKECDRYAGLLAAQPVDFCCLGIGENGHLAFNDPEVANFADPRPVKIVRLDEACRQQQVGEGHFCSLEKVPQYALTLTIPALCAARRMLCIVPELRKARAVGAALCGPVATACPASILRRQAHATLFLDAASASEWGRPKVEYVKWQETG